MSPDTPLQHFEAVADAPNGVQKLRELILQLAVRGKLVPQNPNDEPASVLLERIELEKQRLYAMGRNSRPKALPPAEAEEVTFEIPEGWKWVQFGSVIELISGQHLGPTEYNDQGDGIPYLTGPADFGERTPTATRWTHERRAVAQKNDVLLTVKGAGIGKTNVLTESEAAISRQLMAIRPVLVDGGFASLVAQAATKRFREEQVGIAIPGIGRDDVLHLLIALAPLPEQRRIVEKVDQLMALCDELVERQQRRAAARVRLNRASLHHLTAATDDADLAEHWQRIRDNFHLLYDAPETVTELRQAILQLAVRGKLVPQESTGEPASVLLERIKAEKEQLISEGRGKTKGRRPSHSSETPFDVPDGWEWARFGDLLLHGSTGLDRGRSQQGSSLAYLYFKMNNISSDGRCDLTSMTRVDASGEEVTRYRLQGGDFLFNTRNSVELVGKTCVFSSSYRAPSFFGHPIGIHCRGPEKGRVRGWKIESCRSAGAHSGRARSSCGYSGARISES